jgi:hypothetical protein
MVEIWLLFSLLQPFVDVVLQTYIYYYTNITEITSVPIYSARKLKSAWTKNENKYEIMFSLC